MVLKLPPLFIICTIVHLTTLAESFEKYIVIHENLDWNDSINACSSIGGRSPSFSEANYTVSTTNALMYHDYYWILRHQHQTQYSYQGCFNASTIDFNYTEITTPSIKECLDACQQSDYFAVSTDSCVCFQNTSYLDFEQNCSQLCQNDFSTVSGRSEYFLTFQRNNTITHGNSVGSSCIYERSGDDITENCNVILDGYLCGNGSDEQIQNGQCPAFSISTSTYRNCSELLPSLCIIENPRLTIGANETSWTSAKEECRFKNGHLINPEHLSKHIILSELYRNITYNSSEYYWVDSTIYRNRSTETEVNMSSDAVSGCVNNTSDNVTRAEYNDTENIGTNCTNVINLTPGNCTALKIEGMDLKTVILSCERTFRFLCQIDMDTSTADPLSTSMEADGAISTITLLKSDIVTTDSTHSAASTTTTESQLLISHAVYGLIGGIVTVVLILSIVCVIFCFIFRKYKDQQRELSMLKGPTISYSNLEHSDFNSSMKAAIANNNSEDDDVKTNETDENQDLVARIVIRDDNSDVKSMDNNYTYCDVVDEKLNEKPKTENNNVLTEHSAKESNETKGTVNQKTTELYSFASPPEDDNIYQNETELKDTSDKTAKMDGVIDGDEVYENHQPASSDKDVQNNSNEYSQKQKDKCNTPKIDDEIYSNSQVSDDEYSELSKHCTKPDTNCSEYDHVKLDPDDYDHLDPSQRGAAKTKPVVIHYEEVVLP